jgi:ligand-binding SRPBCC domain-containing protein
MKEFRHRFRVAAPLDDVTAFHRDTRALKFLTPPPVYVQFHHVEPVGENSRSEFTMWVGPVPIRWVALHTEYDPKKGFVDTQVDGPFQRWVHQHSFSAVDEGTTEVSDSIQAELGAHPFWKLVGGFMWISLPLLFTYRAWVTRRRLENRNSKQD